MDVCNGIGARLHRLLQETIAVTDLKYHIPIAAMIMITPPATVTPAINPFLCISVGVLLVGVTLMGDGLVPAATIVPPSFCPISAALCLITLARRFLETNTEFPEVITAAHSITTIPSTSFRSDGM